MKCSELKRPRLPREGSRVQRRNLELRLTLCVTAYHQLWDSGQLRVAQKLCQTGPEVTSGMIGMRYAELGLNLPSCKHGRGSHNYARNAPRTTILRPHLQRLHWRWIDSGLCECAIQWTIRFRLHCEKMGAIFTRPQRGPSLIRTQHAYLAELRARHTYAPQFCQLKVSSRQTVT